MSRNYNPYDWYWLASDGRLFSSSRKAIIKPDDAAFIAWSTGGITPTPWPRDDAGSETDGALQDVLSPYGLAAPG